MYQGEGGKGDLKLGDEGSRVRDKVRGAQTPSSFQKHFRIYSFMERCVYPHLILAFPHTRNSEVTGFIPNYLNYTAMCAPGATVSNVNGILTVGEAG